MKLCSEHNHYKVCVVFDTRKAMIEFIEELIKIGDIPDVGRVITRRTVYGRYKFFNGSVLEIITVTENNLRGRKCNQLIASGVFDRETQARMERMIVPYRALDSITDWKMEYEALWYDNDDLPTEPFEESEELAAFLDSFAVSKKC